MARFIVDEDLPRSLSRALVADGIDSEDVRDVGLQAHSDRDIFAYAVRQGRAIITGDVEFGNITLYSLGQHAGIVLVRFPNEASPRSMNAAIVASLRLLPDSDLAGNLVVLEPGKLRIRRKP